MNKQRKAVLFLVRFFAVYFLLFSVYSWYLQSNQKKEPFYQCASITTFVAKQAVGLMNVLEANAYYQQHEKELSVKIIYKNRYVARVIEGCNSLSVIILFLSFIVAFRGSILNTTLFGIIGSTIIYGINICRIALLTFLLDRFPNQESFLHNLIFPAIIYGVTFLLWVLWAQKFSSLKK